METKEVIKYFIDKIISVNESKDRKIFKLENLKRDICSYIQIGNNASFNYCIDNEIDLTLYDSLNIITCQIRQELLREIDNAINNL